MTELDCKQLLRNFLDQDGKLKQWPSKRKLQIVGLVYCATVFEDGRRYGEKEVNDLLNSIHTFGDFCTLRRDLCDMRFLARTADGREYWKLPAPDLSSFNL